MAPVRLGKLTGRPNPPLGVVWLRVKGTPTNSQHHSPGITLISNQSSLCVNQDSLRQDASRQSSYAASVAYACKWRVKMRFSYETVTIILGLRPRGHDNLIELGTYGQNYLHTLNPKISVKTGVREVDTGLNGRDHCIFRDRVIYTLRAC